MAQRESVQHPYSQSYTQLWVVKAGYAGCASASSSIRAEFPCFCTSVLPNLLARRLANRADAPRQAASFGDAKSRGLLPVFFVQLSRPPTWNNHHTRTPTTKRSSKNSRRLREGHPHRHPRVGRCSLQLMRPFPNSFLTPWCSSRRVAPPQPPEAMASETAATMAKSS